MLSFGEKLRSERERRNTTLEEIAGATKIGLSYLEALEHDEFEALPGRNFGKLYIREYAEVVGFDPQPLIDDYDREQVRRRREARRLAKEAKAAERATQAKQVEQQEEPAEVAPDVEPVPDEAPSADKQPPHEEAPPESAAAAEEQKAEPRVESTTSGPRLLALVLLAAGLIVVAVWVWFAVLRTDEPPLEPEPPTQSSAPIEASPIVVVPPPVIEQAPAQPAAEPPAVVAASPLSVTDFGIGRRVVNRRLVERGETFEEGAVVFFSTRVIGGEAGSRVRHVWFREGKPVQRVDLELGGPHWRTHSRKTLWGVGDWAVEARDPNGQVLARSTFSCVERS